VRSRPYLRSFNAQLTPFSKSAGKPEGQMVEEAEEEQGGTLYGTSINIRRAMTAVEHFLVHFHLEGQNIYRNQLIDMQDNEEAVFQVDGRHILAADRELYLQFIYYPVEMISCFDQVLKDLYENYFIANETDATTRVAKQDKKQRLMLGLKHLAEADRTLIKELDSSKIGRLVALQGIVIRASEIHPEMKTAYFTCAHCGHSVELELENARVTEPRSCVRCRSRECMDIHHNLCTFTDKQYIKFQELPEYVTEGETPGAVTVLAYDSNVDGFRPGDRVELIGIYRAASSLVQRNKNQVRTIFNTYIDMISFSLLEEKHHKINTINIAFSDDEKKRFRNTAESPVIWDLLANSFAPSIFGHTIVKKGLLTQLFGGTRKKFEEIGRNRFRSDINICLLGDPSTAKSQLLQQVHKISSRSIYTSGRGSSAVGLTANVRKDPETREFVL
jgi:DNA replication licensing factor MCM4